MPWLDSSSRMSSGDISQPKKMHSPRAQRGNMYVPLSRSVRSKRLRPIIVMCPSMPLERDRTTATAREAAVHIIAERGRRMPETSVSHTQRNSNNEIALVSAAMTSSRKKAIETYCPTAPMELNTTGSTLKTSPAPSAGFMPQENTAGKMAMPERMAIMLSERVIQIVVFRRLSSFGI